MVAITTTAVAEAGPFRRLQVTLYSLYLEVLERHGMAPLLLTPTHTRASMASLLDQCRGLVLSGGEDLDPSYYGEAPLPGLGVTNPARDEAELVVLELALERELPILAICRGCQLTNVYLGGTLYQDLTLQRSESLEHRQKEPWGRRSHRVSLDPDSELARIAGSDEIFINSFHHQGIKDVGEGLEVVAEAEDGTIEAVEWPGAPAWFLGVQWHPERYEASAPRTDPDRRIFQTFAEEVGVRWRWEAKIA